MSALTHTLRIRTTGWQRRPSLVELESIASEINYRAQGRRMIGQIDVPGDGKMRLDKASHLVLPTARVRGSAIMVEIEILEQNSPGRAVAAFIKSGLAIQGNLRGNVSRLGSATVFSIDIDLDPNPEETVLDDIVDALEASDIQG